MALDGSEYHLHLESWRVVPPRSSLHSLLLIRKLKRARSQAETPPIALCRFPGPVLTDGHLGRWYLKGAAGDAANVILSAVGHSLRLVLAWQRPLFAYS